MKNTIRRVLVGVMCAACITAWFTGCSSEPEPFDVDLAGPSTSISESVPSNSSSSIGGFPDSAADMFMRYWYGSADSTDSVKTLEAFKTSKGLTKTGDSILGGLVDIYKAKDGTRYIISGYTPVEFTGTLTASQIVSLRMEETGERIYIVDSQEEYDKLVSEVSKFMDTLSRNGISQPSSDELRISSRGDMDLELVLLDKSTTVVALNNMPTEMSFVNGAISIGDIIDNGMNYIRLDSVSTANKSVELVVNAAGKSFNVKVFADDSGEVSKIIADGIEFTSNLDGCLMGSGSDLQLYLTPEVIQRCLGFDVEIYGSINVINIVTDQKDLMATDNIVIDTPEQAEAEQSTQGATDKVTPQAPSGDEAIKQDIEQQLPQTTPQVPDPDKDYSNMSGNDLLEEILGNNNIPSGGTSSGDYSSDKPGMGWNNITDSDPNATTGNNGFTNEDFNWD